MLLMDRSLLVLHTYRALRVGGAVFTYNLQLCQAYFDLETRQSKQLIATGTPKWI